MVTIKDIAEKTGLGIGTVSRALNGGKNVKPDTLRLVLDTARAMGYSPNQAARMLAKGEYASRTVGVVLPFIIHPFYFEILKGVQKAFYAEHLNMLMFDLGEDPQPVFEHIVSENLAGVLFVACEPTEITCAGLTDARIPFMHADFLSHNAASFYVDNALGGELAARYLHANGCRKVAYVGEIMPNQQQYVRFSGFAAALESLGMELVERTDVPSDGFSSVAATEKLLKKGGIEGIFYFCDEIAYGGLKAKTASGSNVRIIGFDDLSASAFLGLSTIRQPAYEMGFEAAKRIVESIKDYDNRNLENKAFEPVLIDRGS